MSVKRDYEGVSTATKMRKHARENPEQYLSGFADWCDDNKAIVEAFATKSWQIAQRGRKHYSARTIIEVLRHESALAEVGSLAADWKINNNRAPDLARAFMYASHINLFETRNR